MTKKNSKKDNLDVDKNIDDIVNDMLNEARASMTVIPSDLPARYKLAEDRFYEQLTQTQDVLSAIISEGNAKEIRAMAAVSKDLLYNYNESTRLRKLSEIECGKVIPIKVLEQYQKDIFPAIASGIDNLKLEILNSLQPSTRADFEGAWNKGYAKFINTLKEAADKLQGYLDDARLEATGMAPKKTYRSKKEGTKQKMAEAATRRHSREKNLS